MASTDIKFKVKLLDQSVQELELDATVSVIKAQRPRAECFSDEFVSAMPE
jgi:hypothetical protein